MRTKQDQIRALNDQLRQEHKGGSIVVSAGIQALDADLIQKIGDAVVAFDSFSEDNDPYGEHDLGIVCVAECQVMFKIDYYDLDFRYHSPDPANPAVTRRVLTLMLVQEY
jgi:hypothetical protein